MGSKLGFVTMLRSGKYAGQTYAHVENDPKYCSWILDKIDDPHLPKDLRKFGRHLEKTRGGLMRIGKHKDTWFHQIHDKDPSYIEWAAELSDPSGPMKKFSSFARKKIEEEIQPPSKKPRNKEEDDGEKKCAVCMHANIDCAFVPCGHSVTCFRCGLLVEASGCPVCRAQIVMPLRLYT